jgi:putative membrane protein
MFLVVLTAGLHYLALALGLGGLFTRGIQFRALKLKASNEAQTLKTLFLADNFWGVAALLWITTGLWRAFGHLEKTPDFYLHNVFFYIKMALFGLVFLLEILPMVTLIQWRIQLRKKRSFKVPQTRLDLFILLNNLELALVLIIPFVAVAMARGVWLMP